MSLRALEQTDPARADVLDQPRQMAGPVLTLVPYVPISRSRWQYAIPKRSFDLILSSLLILGMLPFGIAIGGLIAATSRGPIIYRHQRCGIRGSRFACLKFRTMVINAEKIHVLDPTFQLAFAENWKLNGDPRVTKVGRFLRKSSLDEIPQLFNIWRGHMSFVGPRPVQQGELDARYGDRATDLMSVKPGLTGLWQVSGRSLLTYQERVDLDLEYVRRKSFWFDLKIVARTVPAVCSGRGAV